MNYFSEMKKLVEQLGPSATSTEIDIVEDAVIAAIKLRDDAFDEVMATRELQAEANKYLETLSDYFKPREDDKWQQEYNQRHINDGDWESGPVIVDVSE